MWQPSTRFYSLLLPFQVDILVNNGGRTQVSLIRKTSLEVERAVLGLNTVGTISLTKAVLPHMIKRRAGQIVFVSSIFGKFGNLDFFQYIRQLTQPRQREGQDSDRFRLAKQQLCTCITLLCIFLCRRCTSTTKGLFTWRWGPQVGEVRCSGSPCL